MELPDPLPDLGVQKPSPNPRFSSAREELRRVLLACRSTAVVLGAAATAAFRAKQEGAYVVALVNPPR